MIVVFPMIAGAELSVINRFHISTLARSCSSSEGRTGNLSSAIDDAQASRNPSMLRIKLTDGQRGLGNDDRAVARSGVAPGVGGY
jgi:hypothetical protein